MNTYTAHFRTETGFATQDIEADTPKRALAKARKIAATGAHALLYIPYDGQKPINEIAIEDDNRNELALWQDDELTLRNAAANLLQALQQLVERERAEAATCGLTNREMTWLKDARRAIALAKGGAA